METVTSNELLYSTFSREDVKSIQLYFEINEKYYWKLNEDLQQDLIGHPLWGGIFNSLSNEQLRLQNERSLDFQKKAIYENQWDAYYQELMLQGRTYAQMNVSFTDWTEIIKLYRKKMTFYIKKELSLGTEKLIDAMEGMAILFDFAMSAIGESYISEKTEALNQYRYFFENTYDLACIANEDSYFEVINSTFTSSLGYTAQDLTSKPFLEFIHPDDIEGTLLIVDKL
ncbi:MAG: PAS domain-containing protein, partial [Bacteroidetes bacterium]|nr:PAS domain-containing protein [Bacteroidota bacterium]